MIIYWLFLVSLQKKSSDCFGYLTHWRSVRRYQTFIGRNGQIHVSNELGLVALMWKIRQNEEREASAPSAVLPSPSSSKSFKHDSASLALAWSCTSRHCVHEDDQLTRGDVGFEFFFFIGLFWQLFCCLNPQMVIFLLNSNLIWTLLTLYLATRIKSAAVVKYTCFRSRCDSLTMASPPGLKRKC